MYVLFEGIDTCGKSTQIELIKQQFPDIVTTKEPGGTAFGVKARELVLSGDIRSNLASRLLFLADAAEHFTEVIKPNLNKTIISDRGFISGISYGIVNGGLDEALLIRLHELVICDTLPNKVIMFKLPLEELTNRLAGKELDAIEKRGANYLMSIQDVMIRTLKHYDIDYMIIDATDTIDNIHNYIVNYLKL